MREKGGRGKEGEENGRQWGKGTKKNPGGKTEKGKKRRKGIKRKNGGEESRET